MTELRQAAAVARLVLDSSVRSGWALGEVLLVLAVVAISTGGGDPRSPHPAVAYFFGLHGVDFLAASALGAVIMVRRSIGRRALPALSRLRSRRAYAAGMMLAGIALRPPLLALLLSLGVATGRLRPASCPGRRPPPSGCSPPPPSRSGCCRRSATGASCCW